MRCVLAAVALVAAVATAWPHKKWDANISPDWPVCKCADMEACEAEMDAKYEEKKAAKDAAVKTCFAQCGPQLPTGVNADALLACKPEHKSHKEMKACFTEKLGKKCDDGNPFTEATLETSSSEEDEKKEGSHEGKGKGKHGHGRGPHKGKHGKGPTEMMMRVPAVAQFGTCMMGCMESAMPPREEGGHQSCYEKLKCRPIRKEKAAMKEAKKACKGDKDMSTELLAHCECAKAAGIPDLDCPTLVQAMKMAKGKGKHMMMFDPALPVCQCSVMDACEQTVAQAMETLKTGMEATMDKCHAQCASQLPEGLTIDALKTCKPKMPDIKGHMDCFKTNTGKMCDDGTPFTEAPPKNGSSSSSGSMEGGSMEAEEGMQGPPPPPPGLPPFGGPGPLGGKGPMGKGPGGMFGKGPHHRKPKGPLALLMQVAPLRDFAQCMMSCSMAEAQQMPPPPGPPEKGVMMKMHECVSGAGCRPIRVDESVIKKAMHTCKPKHADHKARLQEHCDCIKNAGLSTIDCAAIVSAVEEDMKGGHSGGSVEDTADQTVTEPPPPAAAVN